MNVEVLLVLMFTWNHARSEEDNANFTCPIPAQNCSHDYSGREQFQMECNFLVQVTDVDNQSIEFRNFLRVFVRLDQQCLGMSSVHVKKVSDQVDEVALRLGDLETVDLLNGIRELEMRVRFLHPVPARLPGVLRRALVEELRVVYGELEPGELSSRRTLSALHRVRVRHLALSGGDLKTQFHLTPQPALLSLSLTHCHVSFIHDGVFHSTPSLQYLNLAHNKLRFIPRSVTTLRQLIVLDLSDNPLLVRSDLPFTSSLHGLLNLRVLRLSGVVLDSLSELEVLLHRSPVRLTELHLAGCSISLITPLFEHQPFLQLLDLSNNRLQYVPQDLIQTPQNVTLLNLSSNDLSAGPDLLLNSREVLNVLDLSHNNITIPVNIARTGQVNLVDLSNNNIHTWDGSYSPYDNVHCVNLSYNFINSVSKDMVNTIKTLKCVDLGANPINCKVCDILPFKDWYFGENAVRILNLNTSEVLTCDRSNRSLENVDLLPQDCVTNPLPIMLIPLTMIFSMCLLSGLIMYGYKLEMGHIFHLLQVKCACTTQVEEYKYDAFICYSAAESRWVFHELVPHLENGPERYKLCLHERDFILGSFIAQNIMNFLQSSRKTIIVLTTSFVKSQWCNWELEMAKHKIFEDGRNCLIFLDLEQLNKCTLPRHLRYLMTTQTYIQWPSPVFAEQAAWNRLKTELGDSLYMKQHNVVRV